MYNPARIIGEQIVSKHDGLLGIVTNAFVEGHTLWAVIDDEYEIDVSSCEEVIDLTNGNHFVRIA